MKECAYEEDCYADRPRAETVCTGAGCFSALNGRTHRFREYGDEELQVSAFMKCSGCGHFPGRIKDLMKNREDSEIHPTQFIWESAAAATESKTLCKEVEMIAAIFKRAGIPVVRGTHSVF
ncbi:MAG: CGGC domain-containing protein [Dialister invisus]